jgi:hypothetical protein
MWSDYRSMSGLITKHKWATIPNKKEEEAYTQQQMQAATAKLQEIVFYVFCTIRLPTTCKIADRKPSCPFKTWRRVEVTYGKQ